MNEEQKPIHNVAYDVFFCWSQYSFFRYFAMAIALMSKEKGENSIINRIMT